MKEIKYITIIAAFFLHSCSNQDKTDLGAEIVQEKCPCDSISSYNINGKNVTYAYSGGFQTEISFLPKSDTIEVTKRYATEHAWQFQEYLVVTNNKIVHPELALYCDIKDSAEFYKLNYVSNENLFISQGIVTNSILGVDLILNRDSLSSNSINILVPKEQFKGVIKMDKRLNITQNGKKRDTRANMYLESEIMSKYGNLLEQYKAIKRLCTEK